MLTKPQLRPRLKAALMQPAAVLPPPPAAGDDSTLQLSDFQRRVLGIPEEVDLFLGGGRGGAKSYTLAILALRALRTVRREGPRALHPPVAQGLR